MSTALAIGKRLDRLEGRFRTPQTTMPSALALAARAGFDPDPWQADVLQSTAPRILLNASRQSGKSSTVALLAVHEAISRAGSLTLMLAPTQRQAAELLRTARQFYARSGGAGLVTPRAESALSLVLANGSRVLALPAKSENIRGFASVDLLLADDAARISDELYFSVRPMLAVSGGRLIALSTPYGSRGWFWEAWTGAEPWERYEVPASMCPRISPEFLEEEKQAIGSWWFNQEYLCQFQDAESAAFSSADIRAAFVQDDLGWAV